MRYLEDTTEENDVADKKKAGVQKVNQRKKPDYYDLKMKYKRKRKFNCEEHDFETNTVGLLNKDYVEHRVSMVNYNFVTQSSTR